MKKTRWIRCYDFRVFHNIRFFRNKFPEEEVKVMRFFQGKGYKGHWVDWQLFIVGINFDREDITDPHVVGMNVQHEWVNPNNFEEF